MHKTTKHLPQNFNKHEKAIDKEKENSPLTQGAKVNVQNS